MSKEIELIQFLFDGNVNPLSVDVQRWINTSRRFMDFAERYREKIRKKLRVAREMERNLDVRGELEVAYCLLSDRRLHVEYEPYSTQKRGTDFAVTYRSNLRFNVEVTRMRADESLVAGGDISRWEERILRILLSKLGQMQPGMGNLLVIHTPREIAQTLRLEKLMQEIKSRVEGRDRSFYESSGYVSPAAFYKDFLHLSGIVFWSAEAQLWVNKQARPELDLKVLRLVSSLAAYTA